MWKMVTTHVVLWVSLALSVSAAAINAGRSITIKVTGPASVTTIKDLKVTATIINTGNVSLKLINDSLCPLSGLPTETFDITSGIENKGPTFTGMRITPVSEAEVVNEDLVVLAPSESIDVEHDLSMSYDFRSAGEGHYSIAARSRCMAFEDNSGELIPVDTTVQAHSVHVSGRLAVARPTVEKRAWFTGCSAQQQKALYDASSAAQILAATAVDYLQTHNESTTRYTTWFGEYTPARHDYVLSIFFKLATKNNFYDSFWYDCTGSTACSKARAWVWPSDWGHIYLCPQSRIFGGNVTSGSYSLNKAGTLIHEASHFNVNGASQDYSLYVTDTMNLAKTSPDKAIRNANAYDFFAENSPPLD